MLPLLPPTVGIPPASPFPDLSGWGSAGGGGVHFRTRAQLLASLKNGSTGSTLRTLLILPALPGNSPNWLDPS